MISENEIKHLGELARLEISDQEIKDLTSDLEQILSYVNVLEEIDVAAIKPWQSNNLQANILRDDVEKDALVENQNLIARAPQSKDNYFVVPPIFE